MLGDIVICPQVATTQAATGGHSVEDEILLLTTHGMLHLLGFDHAEPEENTIFEHDNCASIKIFYYQDSENTDKYLETYKNISRNFNDKAKLRDRVVNWQLSEPLIPYRLKPEVMKDLENEKLV